MSHSTGGVKVLETRDEGSLDRISLLPDELLGHLLSFLSTCDAVKTSILSTRWRYLFTLTDNLSFDDKEFFGRYNSRRKVQSEDLKTSFEKFVYRVLALHKVSSIEKFSLSLYGDLCEYDSSHLRVWISDAILKKVRHLNLRISYFPISLPDCVFNSQTLVKLVIDSDRYNFRVPGIVSLPSLRTLELHYITFSDADSVDRFFVGCSQLKELALYCCQLTNDLVRVSAKALEKLTAAFCHGHAEIDVPNLANLSYICSASNAGVDVPLSLKNFCSISSVELGFRYSSTKFDPTQAVLDLITIARNARELTLTYDSPKLLTRVEHSEIPTYTNQLKSLHLGDCCPDTWEYVTLWLTNAAQLETLVFGKGLTEKGTDASRCNWDPNSSLAPFSSNVKYIEVYSFNGYKLELRILKYLLTNAGALKRLILYMGTSMTKKEELHARKELSMFPKASSDCTIELKTPPCI